MRKAAWIALAILGSVLGIAVVGLARGAVPDVRAAVAGLVPAATTSPTPSPTLSPTPAPPASPTDTGTPAPPTTPTLSPTPLIFTPGPTNTPVSGTFTPTPLPSPPACGLPGWHALAVPDVGSLAALAVVGAQDIWAGGRSGFLHWNGWAWNPVAAPLSGTVTSLVAVAADNVWGADGGVLHWDGHSWTHVAVATPPFASFVAVAAAGPASVWAVGTWYSVADSGYRPLVEHWNGTAWQQIAVETPFSDCQVNDTPHTAFAAGLDDLWIGDTYQSCLTTEYVFHCTATACADALHRYLVPAAGLAGSGPTDVWAAGGTPDDHSAVNHWDGTAWTVQPVPDISRLLAIAEGAPNNIWALGEIQGTLHYDGQSWRAIPDTGQDTMRVIVVADAGDVWDAGHGPFSESAVHYYATGQVFTDVPAGQPFYPWVQDLACAGVISGYACGGPGEPCDLLSRPYFRPGADVTRGQAAKLVALAAGIAGAETGQLFEDVPPAQPFYPWVQALASAGLVSGYTCGGPGEPCVLPGNRPYFRPGADVTRGQLAKIVAGAAGYSDPAGPQVFEDVPPAHPFYLWIGRVAAHGLISGYACGGPGEPCVEPGHRPYFRAYNPATRGQTSKVVDSAFHPPPPTPGAR